MPTTSNEAILFRSCAIHYLCQWFLFDRRYVEAAQQAVSTELLQEFFAEYKVIRQFPGKNHERLDPVARQLNKLVVQRGSLEPVKVVDELVEVMKPLTLGGKVDCISAASKAAWITVQSPVYVFDSRSKNGLHRARLLPRSAVDYASFWRAWVTYRERSSFMLGDAMSWLAGTYPGLSMFPQVSTSEEEFLDLIASPWFQDRVLDFRLLLKGDPGGEDQFGAAWMPAPILIKCLQQS